MAEMPTRGTPEWEEWIADQYIGAKREDMESDLGGLLHDAGFTTPPPSYRTVDGETSRDAIVDEYLYRGFSFGKFSKGPRTRREYELQKFARNAEAVRAVAPELAAGGNLDALLNEPGLAQKLTTMGNARDYAYAIAEADQISRMYSYEEQQKIWDGLEPDAQQRLRAGGYRPPTELTEREMGVMGFDDQMAEIFGGVGDAIGSPVGFAGRNLFGAFETAENALTTTVRLGDRWAKTGDLNFSVEGWKHAWHGEQFFAPGTFETLYGQLGDATAANLAVALSSGMSMNEFVAASTGYELNSPEFMSAMSHAIEQSQQPEFQQALRDLGRNKTSFGRTMAGLFLDRDDTTELMGMNRFDAVSGVFDAAFLLKADPTLVAGRLRKGAYATRYGLISHLTDGERALRKHLQPDLIKQVTAQRERLGFIADIDGDTQGYLKQLGQLSLTPVQRQFVMLADAVSHQLNNSASTAVARYTQMFPEQARLAFTLVQKHRRSMATINTPGTEAFQASEARKALMSKPQAVIDHFHTNEGIEALWKGYATPAHSPVVIVPRLSRAGLAKTRAKLGFKDTIDWYATDHLALKGVLREADFEQPEAYLDGVVADFHARQMSVQHHTAEVRDALRQQGHDPDLLEDRIAGHVLRELGVTFNQDPLMSPGEMLAYYDVITGDVGSKVDEVLAALPEDLGWVRDQYQTQRAMYAQMFGFDDMLALSHNSMNNPLARWGELRDVTARLESLVEVDAAGNVVTTPSARAVLDMFATDLANRGIDDARIYDLLNYAEESAKRVVDARNTRLAGTRAVEQVPDGPVVGTLYDTAPMLATTLRYPLSYGARLLKRMSMIPKDNVLIFNDPNSTETLKRILDYRVWGGDQRKILSAYLMAEDDAARMLIGRQAVRTVFERTGMMNDPTFDFFVRRWVDQFDQRYGPGDMLETSVGPMRAGMLPRSHRAKAMKMPPLREIEANARKVRMMHLISGHPETIGPWVHMTMRAMEPIGDWANRLMSAWRAAVVLRPAMIPRAAGEEAVAFGTRRGFTRLFETWLATGTADRAGRLAVDEDTARLVWHDTTYLERLAGTDNAWRHPLILLRDAAAQSIDKMGIRVTGDLARTRHVASMLLIDERFQRELAPILGVDANMLGAVHDANQGVYRMQVDGNLQIIDRSSDYSSPGVELDPLMPEDLQLRPAIGQGFTQYNLGDPHRERVWTRQLAQIENDPGARLVTSLRKIEVSDEELATLGMDRDGLADMRRMLGLLSPEEQHLFATSMSKQELTQAVRGLDGFVTSDHIDKILALPLEHREHLLVSRSLIDEFGEEAADALFHGEAIPDELLFQALDTLAMRDTDYWGDITANVALSSLNNYLKPPATGTTRIYVVRRKAPVTGQVDEATGELLHPPETPGAMLPASDIGTRDADEAARILEELQARPDGENFGLAYVDVADQDLAPLLIEDDGYPFVDMGNLAPAGATGADQFTDLGSLSHGARIDQGLKARLNVLHAPRVRTTPAGGRYLEDGKTEAEALRQVWQRLVSNVDNGLASTGGRPIRAMGAIERGRFHPDIAIQEHARVGAPAVLTGPKYMPVDDPEHLLIRATDRFADWIGNGIRGIIRQPMAVDAYARALDDFDTVMRPRLGTQYWERAVRALDGKVENPDAWLREVGDELQLLQAADPAFADEMSISQMRGLLDELVPDATWGDRDAETLTRWWRKESRIRERAHRGALERTIAEATPFIDDYRIRSQFGDLARNIFPFWFAQEQFYKRWARTVRMSPEGLRKLQLIHQGLTSVGWIKQDERGNDIFVYPGSQMLMEVVGDFAAALGIVDEDWAIPQAIPLTGEIRYAAPGFDGLAGPQGGPLVSLPLGALRTVFPEEVRRLEGTLLGDRGVGRDWAEQLLPSYVLKGWRAYNASEADLYRDMIGAAQLLEANDPEWVDEMLGEGTTTEKVERYKDRLRSQAKVLQMTRAFVAWAGPASPQAEYDEHLLSSEFQEYLDITDDYESAIALFLQENPDALPYTVYATENPSKSPARAIEAAEAVIDANREWFENVGAVGAWFYPSPEMAEPDDFSMDVWQDMLNHRARTRQDFTSWYREFVMQRDVREYKDMQDAYQAAINVERRPQEKAQLKHEWSTWMENYKRSHQLFAEEWFSQTGVQEREAMIAEVARLGTEGDVPDVPQAERLVTLATEYQALNTALQQLGPSQAGFVVEKREAMKNTFLAWAVPYAADDFMAKSFFERMIWRNLNMSDELESQYEEEVMAGG